MQGGAETRQRELALRQSFDEAREKIEEEALRHVDELQKQYLLQLGTTQCALSEQAQAHIAGLRRESQDATNRAQLLEQHLKKREGEFRSYMDKMKQALFRKDEELRKSKLLPGTEKGIQPGVGST